MLENSPTKQEIVDIIGKPLYDVWQELCQTIDEKYEMDCLWNHGGKKWQYEYKYRRGGKTLCCMYIKEDCVGFMVIFGKQEREKFELSRENYSKEIQQAYDEAKTFHDGKWMLFEPRDTSLFNEYIQLLQIKRKPNRKQ